MNANVRPGNWVVVVGAGGGLGHLAGETCFSGIGTCESANGFQFNMLGPKAHWSLVSIPGLAKGTF